MTTSPELRSVLEATKINGADVLGRLRETPLVGFYRARVYADASLEIAEVSPDELAPAQRYVLRSGVRRALDLRKELRAFDIDPFALEGGALISRAGASTPIPLLPPIVESSIEPDGREVLLVNDGLHRVYAARSVGVPIRVVLVRDVPRQWPYYALALPAGWSDVVELDALPAGFQKKEYRVPQNYKALFRDLNAVFPGIQEERAATNPTHLRR